MPLRIRIATACFAVLVAASAHGQTPFIATMTHDQETTRGEFLTSTGQPRPQSFGSAVFALNEAQTQLTFTANVFNIDVTGLQTPNDTNDNLVSAHIHVGALPGFNAPVRWGFFGTPDNDTAPKQLVVTPFTTGVGGTFSSIWDAGEGNAGTTLASNLPDIFAGRSYINFHTVQFGGGEVRGQIVPEPSAAAVLGLALLGLTSRRFGRRVP
jgi:hypothetical protein